MKTFKWIVVLAIGLMAAQVHAEEKAKVPESKMDKVSYGIGVNMGSSLKVIGADINVDILVKGLRDALSGAKVMMTDDDIRAALTAFQTELRQKQAEAMKQAAEINQKEGEAFLAENKAKEGVVTLPSGLQYKIVKAGNGKMPTDADTVECHYRGTLINGTEFDSSYKRGEPATFEVGRIIPGWKEALKIMPVGSKWQLFIPSQLGYGPMGQGPDIGPNSTLIFELDLLAIK